MEEEYLSELIDRMLTKEERLSSDQSVSWKAYREAERLDDVSFYPYIRNTVLIYTKPREKKLRGAAYFIWGKLLKNCPLEEYTIYYLQQIKTETDKYILSGMLDRVAEIVIPSHIPIDVIADLAMNDKWLIRHSALCALGSSSTVESKNVLLYYINQTDEKNYKYEIIYANASLGRIGALKDIQVLEQHHKSKIRDIRGSAEFAIANIKERTK